MTTLALVHRYIQKIHDSGIPVTQAYLFGSYAMGTSSIGSDIDVCVISPIFGIDPISEMVTLRRIAYGVDARIEPIPLHPNDLNDPYSPLAANIRKTGQSVLEFHTSA